MLLYKKLLLMTFGTSLVCLSQGMATDWEIGVQSHTRYKFVLLTAVSRQAVGVYSISHPIDKSTAG